MDTICVGLSNYLTKFLVALTISETTVISRIPERIRAKDLEVTIRPTSVSVQLKEATASSSFLLERGPCGQ
jgi:hypothetical protein